VIEFRRKGFGVFPQAMAARVGWRGFTGLAVIADAPISRCNSSLFGDSDKVVYEFYQRAEPMARFQFSGIVRAVPGTILFNQPNWRTGVASGGSVRQALKDRDQLTELGSPAIEEVESEENRR
jgi:hypothetical protein